MIVGYHLKVVREEELIKGVFQGEAHNSIISCGIT